MQKLEEQQLADVSGGVAKGHVIVTVTCKWSGEAAKHLKSYGPIKVTLTDPEGTGTAYFTLANNWTVKFQVLKGVEFYCDMDLRKYWPKIKKCTDTWDQKTNVFTYYIS